MREAETKVAHAVRWQRFLRPIDPTQNRIGVAVEIRSEVSKSGGRREGKGRKKDLRTPLPCPLPQSKELAAR